MSSRGQALKPYHLCHVKLSPLPLLTSLSSLACITYRVRKDWHYVECAGWPLSFRLPRTAQNGEATRPNLPLKALFMASTLKTTHNKVPTELEETAPTNGEIWPLVKNTLQSSEHALLHRVAGRHHAAGIGMLGGVFSAPSSVMIS